MKSTLSLVILIIVTAMFFMGSRIIENNNQLKITYPHAVKQIIDKKCYGCHNIKGNSQNAKEALMWDSLPNLSTRVLVSTLDKIIEVVDKEAMPPGNFTKKYPEAKLLPGERELLKSWAEVKADNIMK